MKETFAKELVALAKTCNVTLSRRGEQVIEWTDEFGKDPCEIIRSAFAKLRQAGGFGHSWPTYQEIKRAFAKARADASSEAEQELQKQRIACPVPPNRFAVCMLYGRLTRSHFTMAEVEEGMRTILNVDSTDEAVEALIEAARERIAKLSHQPGDGVETS